MSRVGLIRDSKLTDRFDWNSRDGVTRDAGERTGAYWLAVRPDGQILACFWVEFGSAVGVRPTTWHWKERPTGDWSWACLI